jgi:hypothetical protein
MVSLSGGTGFTSLIGRSFSGSTSPEPGAQTTPVTTRAPSGTRTIAPSGASSSSGTA